MYHASVVNPAHPIWATISLVSAIFLPSAVNWLVGVSELAALDYIVCQTVDCVGALGSAAPATAGNGRTAGGGV